jgi:hypothetical protein
MSLRVHVTLTGTWLPRDASEMCAVLAFFLLN